MGSSVTSSHRTERRAAVQALQAALATRRQHPETPAMWQTAHRRAVQAIGTACRGEALEFALRAGEVVVDEQVVHHFHPDDRPFGQLRAAGIGEVRLEADLQPEPIDALLTLMTHLSICTEAETEFDALLRLHRIDGIALRATSDLPGPEGTTAGEWDALPPPLPASARLRALVARDTASNWPALAARQLLEDLRGTDASDPARDASFEVLGDLMARLLAADDLGTVTWLLTELQARPDIPPAAHRSLLQMVRAHATSPWLADMLGRGSSQELLQLSALALQLGDDTAARFAAAALAVEHPLSQWLGELLAE